jgi:hypothetical protein
MTDTAPTSAERPELSHPESTSKAALTLCDWVYFTTPAKGRGLRALRQFVSDNKVIICHAYSKPTQDAGGHPIHARPHRIANIRHLRAGHRVLLAYGGDGEDYTPVFVCTLGSPQRPLDTDWDSFDVLTEVDASLAEQLERERYEPDPVLGKFIGISIAALDDISAPCQIKRPNGLNSLWRWQRVFPSDAR